MILAHEASATSLVPVYLPTTRATVPASPRRLAPPPHSPSTSLPIRQRLSVLLANNRPIAADMRNPSKVYRFAKRVLDVVGALALIVLFAPLLLIALAVLTVTTKGRPFFVQERIGFRGRKFPMFKFRTMHVNAEQLQAAVKNEQDGPIFKNRRDPRITRFGRLLRKTSIDEMPQLLNVLAGHMSLVGPRPPVEREVRQYQLWQLRRLSIKPGLTCLWQISGRSEIGFSDWVRMDLWYLKNQNLRTDLRLITATPLSVLSCRGAY